MQRYCRPVKAIEVGDKVYRTPAPAAKAIAWFIAQDLIKPELQSLRVLRGDAFKVAHRAVLEHREHLEQKAARRVISIMRKYFKDAK